MMRKMVVLAVLACLLLPGVAGQAFNFGITPTEIHGGVKEPGESFYVSFYAFSSSGEDLEVDIEQSRANLRDFRRVGVGDAVEFSEQECSRCVEILSGGGELDEQDSSINSGEKKTNRWKKVELLVKVPEDAEPGYHMVNIMPQPRKVGDGGGQVSVVSTSSLPITFRVPGEAVRSGQILGMRSGENAAGRQKIIATFYNSGTVTLDASAQFEVETRNGTETVNAGSLRVEPGETREFRAAVDSSQIGDSFDVRVNADYATGTSVKEDELERRSAVSLSEPQEEIKESFWEYVLAVLVVATTGFLTWRLMRRV